MTLAEEPTGSTRMRTRFEDIQAHYDVSDDFFALFQDPTRTYSCAYFEPPDLTLRTGPVRQNRPQPGPAGPQTRHDTARHRLRLGHHHEACRRKVRRQRHRPDPCPKTSTPAASRCSANSTPPARAQVRLHGWEDFNEPVDRIVSIEAFEHFGHENYDDFFKRCFDIMPDDGRMTVQSSVSYHPYNMHARGKKLTFETVRFIKFIITEIFPGGRLPSTEMMVEHGEKAGFTVPEPLSLRPHYIKTLRIWGDTLESTREGHRGHPPKRSTSAT